ncbi:MAG: outer membrane beta-barrel protein, partial [Thermoanaerobaculia bacterium]
MPEVNSRKLLLGGLIAWLFVPAIMFGQGFQTGTINAIVTDQTGATLPGVTVTVTSEERGTQRSNVTDTSGSAKFAVLPLGFYRVEAALSGFSTAIRPHNRVEADKTTELPMTLSLASTGETITVTGQQPVVDRTNVSVNTEISTKEFDRAPVLRGYQSLMTLAAGVVDQPGNPSAGNPQVHGAPTTANVYLFDGVDSTDPTNGQFGANLNFDAIQEVSVQTAGMSAEYGRATGAVLNVITKSGTNQYEGSFRSIQTNDKWNAQNTTHNQVTGESLARDRVNHNSYDYSATLGGPVWRDHLWFFGAYEKSTTTTAATTTTVSGEEYTQTTDLKLPNYRLYAQITPTQSLWAKYDSDPISGFINDYWGEAPELFSLTAQDQGGDRRTAQYSGIFGQNV